VYRNDDVVAASHNAALHGPGAFGPSFGGRRPLIPMDLDGGDHAKYVRFLAPMFAPRAVGRGENTTRALAGELVDGFVADGRVELVERYCRPLAALSFLDMFGLPRGDFPFLLDFVEAVVRPKGRTHDERVATAHQAGQSVYDYLQERIDERERAGSTGPGVLGELLSGAFDGRRLTHEEVQDISYLFIIAGIEMVPAALTCIFAWLAQRPVDLNRLVADPHQVPPAIEELLRYETPTPAAARLATEDVVLPGGDLIAKGERVRLLWATANLDDRTFDDPLEVDFGRQQRSNVAFGNGHHRCLGAPLSRMQLRVAVTEFHRRIPHYRIDPSEPPLYLDFGVRKRLPLRFTAAGTG
jgi:cytochrome P450